MGTLFALTRRSARCTRLAKALLVPTAILCAAGLLGTSGQAQTPSFVTRLDPALDRIVPGDSNLELLVEDYFGSSEGPVWVPDGSSGYLLFSDQAANRVYKWSANRALSVFLEPSGYTGDPAKWMDVAFLFFNGRLHIGLIGSNGLAIDREGRLIMCTVGDRAIVRVEKDGTRTILADRYDGRPLPPPNDLVVKSDGSVYFSAINFLAGRQPQLSFAPNGIYRWRQGEVHLVTSDLGGASPNGLAFSPDEKLLYVVVGGKIWQFDVLPDGMVARGRFLVGESGGDGMKVDREGNLYFGGPGGLWIASPSGKHLGTIATGPFTNLAFGDPDRKTLYVMVRRGLARIRLNIPGM